MAPMASKLIFQSISSQPIISVGSEQATFEGEAEHEIITGRRCGLLRTYFTIIIPGALARKSEPGWSCA